MTAGDAPYESEEAPAGGLHIQGKAMQGMACSNLQYMCCRSVWTLRIGANICLHRLQQWHSKLLTAGSALSTIHT